MKTIEYRLQNGVEISTTYLIIRPVRDYFVTRYKLPSVFLFSLIFSFSPSLIFFGLNLNIFPCFDRIKHAF